MSVHRRDIDGEANGHMIEPTEHADSADDHYVLQDGEMTTANGMIYNIKTGVTHRGHTVKATVTDHVATEQPKDITMTERKDALDKLAKLGYSGSTPTSNGQRLDQRSDTYVIAFAGFTAKSDRNDREDAAEADQFVTVQRADDQERRDADYDRCRQDALAATYDRGDAETTRLDRQRKDAERSQLGTAQCEAKRRNAEHATKRRAADKTTADGEHQKMVARNTKAGR